MIDDRRTRIGIFGGTFNPIHLGHLLIARDALEQCGLSCVKFIPAAMPPHKKATPLAPADHRLRMMELAIHGNRQFQIDDIEIRRGGGSYSFETVAQLKEKHPRTDFYFILGSDSYRELHQWHKAKQLVTLCQFIVLARSGYEPKNLHLRAAAFRKLRAHFVPSHPCSISSSEIRQRIAARQSIRYLVPEAVRRYIERHRLYR